MSERERRGDREIRRLRERKRVGVKERERGGEHARMREGEKVIARNNRRARDRERDIDKVSKYLATIAAEDSLGWNVLSRLDASQMEEELPIFIVDRLPGGGGWSLIQRHANMPGVFRSEEGLGFRVWGLGFRVEGLGFRFRIYG